MTAVANDKLALAIQRLERIRHWFDALSTKSKTDAEARARHQDAEAIATVLAAVDDMAREGYRRTLVLRKANDLFDECHRDLSAAYTVLREIARVESPFDESGEPLQVRIAKDLTRRRELAGGFLRSLEP